MYVYIQLCILAYVWEGEWSFEDLKESYPLSRLWEDFPGPDRVNNQQIEKEIICKEEVEFCFNVSIWLQRFDTK